MTSSYISYRDRFMEIKKQKDLINEMKTEFKGEINSFLKINLLEEKPIVHKTVKIKTKKEAKKKEVKKESEPEVKKIEITKPELVDQVEKGKTKKIEIKEMNDTDLNIQEDIDSKEIQEKTNLVDVFNDVEDFDLDVEELDMDDLYDTKVFVDKSKQEIEKPNEKTDKKIIIKGSDAQYSFF